MPPELPAQSIASGQLRESWKRRTVRELALRMLTQVRRYVGAVAWTAYLTCRSCSGLAVHQVTFESYQMRRAQPCEDRTMNNRTDPLTALLIDAVIYAGAGRGTTELACILCGNGVSFEVAMRVLTKPGRRRQLALKLPTSATAGLVPSVSE
jgi:hypothetical protein